MSMGVQAFFFEILISIPLDKNPVVELLDHMVVLFLIFWETSILFFIMAGTNVHSQRCIRDLFLHILANSYLFFFFLRAPDLFIIYLFMAVLGLRFCARAFSSCGKRGPLFIAVRGPLIIAASLVAEHRLQMCRLSNCGSRA